MRKSRNDWQAIVAAYKASGQSQTQWCHANNMNLNNLRYWLQKEKHSLVQEKSCQCLGLDMDTIAAASRNQQLTIVIGPVRLEIAPGFDPQLLAQVLKTIISTC